MNKCKYGILFIPKKNATNFSGCFFCALNLNFYTFGLKKKQCQWVKIAYFTTGLVIKGSRH